MDVGKIGILLAVALVVMALNSPACADNVNIDLATGVNSVNTPLQSNSVMNTNNNAAVGLGGTGGAATNSGTGNAQSINFEQVRQSPSGFAFAPMPTSMCQGTKGLWASFIGGLGIAGSHDIEWCRVMELSRTFAGLGRTDLGVQILCKFDQYASQLAECQSR